MDRFTGQAIALHPNDIPEASDDLAVGEAVVRAVIDVEAAGNWHDDLGRPVMRFERGVFRGRTGRNIAGHPNKWETLKKAYDISPNHAIESTSWGGPQIMGFNHEVVGYRTAREMVNAFAESAGAQLDALVAFIKHTPRLWQAAKDLESDIRSVAERGAKTFAEIYNGPKYYLNKYDTKLLERVGYWKARLPRRPPITPPLPGRKPDRPAELPEIQPPPRRRSWLQRLIDRLRGR